MKRKEREALLALAARLRAVEDPEAQAVAAELESLTPPTRRAGRPVDHEERVLRRVRRAVVAEEIYRGTLPRHLVRPEDRGQVHDAQGRRALADAAAGALLYAAGETVAETRRETLRNGSVYPLGNARRRRRPLTSRDEWEELMALARALAPLD